MPKYYVQSGTLRVTILGDDPFDAIKNTIKMFAGEEGSDHTVDHFFGVNEQGFETIPEHFFPTEEVFERLNIELEE